MNAVRLDEVKNLIKFEQVRKEVAAQHDLKLPDVEIEMSKVRVTPTFDLELPQVGVFRMTDWAKKQLGQALGVQWGKWFDPKLVTNDVVQAEIHRRFDKTHEKKKLRINQFSPTAPGITGCDGYMRAVLTPTYHPIDDERIFNRMEKRFGGRLENLRFMKNHLSKKSSWGNDHCNHYTLVGDAINLGEIDLNHPDPDVKHWYEVAKMENRLPKDDTIYPGFHMRNSEVGYTAITIDEFAFRLVCLNGLMITVGDSRLLYRQHRSIVDDEIDRQLDQAFQRAPERWESTRQKMVRSQSQQVLNPAEFIEIELKRLDAPKYFREAAIKAFDLEPLKTAYGALQAITRAAQDEQDMDKRFEFEAMAGKLLLKA